MKENKIEIIDAQGNVVETTSCPFFGCKIKPKIKCRYGVTDVVVPKKCPLRLGSINVNIAEE